MNDVFHQQHTIKRNNTRYFMCKSMWCVCVCVHGVFFLLFVELNFDGSFAHPLLHSIMHTFQQIPFMILHNDVYIHFSAIFSLHRNYVNYCCCFLFIVAVWAVVCIVFALLCFPSFLLSLASHDHFRFILLFLSPTAIKNTVNHTNRERDLYRRVEKIGINWIFHRKDSIFNGCDNEY